LAVLFHLVKYLGAPEFFADLRPGEEIVAFGEFDAIWRRLLRVEPSGAPAC
jgi:hypothetical protein